MQSCKNLITHLSKIEGQVKALKHLLQSEQFNCEQIVQLSLATNSSFKSFKSKLLQEYLNNEILNGQKVDAKKQEQLSQILKLSK